MNAIRNGFGLGMVAFVVFLLGLVAGSAGPVDNGVRLQVTSAQANAAWTFEGCWAENSSGPCFDIYKDEAGLFWICKACGETGKPNKGKCDKISQDTLDTGFWCS